MEAGSLIIIEPKERFKKISRHIIENNEPIVIGAYCKIVTLGLKTRLNVKYLTKVLGLSSAKTRSIIVFLESEGYIKREPAKDENGKLKGWLYYVYPEQIDENERSCAGKSSVLSETRVVGNPCCRKPDKTENDKDIYKDYNKEDKDLNNEKKKDTEVSKKSLFYKSDEERKFYEGMQKSYPYVAKMEIPLTYEQYLKLLSKNNYKKIHANLDAMNNWKELNKKRRYAYKTLLTWLAKDTKIYE